MKKYVWLIGLLLGFPALGNTSFEWYEGNDWALSRINIFDKTYEFRALNGTWVKKFDLIFEGIDSREMPISASPLAFRFHETVLFSIPGTGQVYQFEKNKKAFRRLDKTFFRGYNFHALQFIKHDTLFSIGGEGFWRSHSILSYFDFKNREWEELKTTGDIPNGVLDIHAGLNLNQTKVYAMEAFQPGNYQVPQLGFYELDLINHKWQKKGELDFFAFKKLGQSTANFNLLGDLMFFSDPQLGYYANPATNQVFKYVGSKKLFFLIESKLFQRGNMLFSVHLDKNDPKGLLKLDSMSLRELGENSLFIGEFYSKKTVLSQIDYPILLIILLLLASIFVNFKLVFNRKNNVIDSSAISMPLGGQAFINLFKVHGESYLVGTEEISVLLGCDKKAFDTQRQYRAQFIISMNQYFAENFQIDEAIVRKATEVDKRIVKYGLKSDAIRVIERIHS
jgi:flagellar biogenesis protein FliO